MAKEKLFTLVWRWGDKNGLSIHTTEAKPRYNLGGKFLGDREDKKYKFPLLFTDFIFNKLGFDAHSIFSQKLLCDA